MTIGNASMEYVDAQISNISSFTNDGTEVIKSKSITSDGGKFVTDGDGNVNISENVIAGGYIEGAQLVTSGSLMIGSSNQFTVSSSGVLGTSGAASFNGGLTTSTLNCSGIAVINGNLQIDGGFTAQGTCTAPTPTTSDSSTNVATTAYVQAQGYLTTTNASSTYLPLAGGTITGETTLTSNLVMNGSILFGNSEWLQYDSSISSLVVTNLQVNGILNNYYANGQGFEFGTATDMAFIDFHTVANTTSNHSTVNDYDVRLATSSASDNSNGNGNLTITAGLVTLPATNITGTLTALTPATSDNSTNVATTAWVNAKAANTTSILMDTDNSDATLATILGDGPNNSSKVSLYTNSSDPTLAETTDFPVFLMNQLSKYATLAYLSSIRGIKNADISASGSSMTLTIPTDNVVMTLANTGTTSASISYSVTSGSISPVDIRRVTIYGGSGVETFTMDGGTLTTTPTVVDNLIYTQSNDTSAHFIRVNGNSYVVTVWISGSGARSSLIYEKFV